MHLKVDMILNTFTIFLGGGGRGRLVVCCGGAGGGAVDQKGKQKGSSRKGTGRVLATDGSGVTSFDKVYFFGHADVNARTMLKKLNCSLRSRSGSCISLASTSFRPSHSVLVGDFV